MRKSHMNWAVGMLLAVCAAVAADANFGKVSAASAKAAVPTSAIVIEADRARLTLYQDGKAAGVWPVAVGKAETPSPLGVFRVFEKRRDWGTGFGTRWMGIDCGWGKFGIHGTNKPSSIGSSASHGCFRMLNTDVEKLYSIVREGTPVIVERGAFGPMGSALRTLSPGDRGADVKEVQLRLKNLGYDCGWPDGVYGEGTKRALLRFKADMRLSYTHFVDGATYQALGIILFE